MSPFRVGSSTIKVWKERGHWAVSVDGLPVGGRHMSEARAAGAGLLQVMFASGRAAPNPEPEVASVGRRKVR